MGYPITQHSGDVFIAVENIRKADAAVRKLYKTARAKMSGQSGATRYFAYCTNERGFPLDLNQLRTFFALMEAHRWRIRRDEAGNVTALTFIGDNYGDDAVILAALAPYATGCIELNGGDGARITFRFVNGGFEKETRHPDDTVKTAPVKQQHTNPLALESIYAMCHGALANRPNAVIEAIQRIAASGLEDATVEALKHVLEAKEPPK